MLDCRYSEEPLRRMCGGVLLRARTVEDRLAIPRQLALSAVGFLGEVLSTARSAKMFIIARDFESALWRALRSPPDNGVG
jgi:hypothetical protein